jgi:hypothetical protein
MIKGPYTEVIREYWALRHDNFILRIMLWNCIGAEHRYRIRQVRRYPYDHRFTIPV